MMDQQEDQVPVKVLPKPRAFMNKEETIRREKLKMRTAQKCTEQAHVLIGSGQYAEALEMYNKAITLCSSPKYLQGSLYFQRGECLRLMENKKCLDDYRSALEGNSQNPAFLEARAKWHTSQTEYSLAVHDLGKAASLAAEGFSHHYFLKRSNVFKLWGKLDGALADLDRAITSGGGAECYLQRADILASQGRFLDSVHDYSMATSLSSNNHEAYYRMGLMHLRLQEYSNAFTQFSFALRVDSSNPDYYIERGRTQILLGNFLTAHGDFESAIRLQNPTPPEYFIFRGISLRGAQKYDQALEDFNQAITLDPTREVFHFCKGLVLQDLERHQEAILSFNQTLTVGGALHHASIYHISLSCHKIGELEASVLGLEKIIKDPEGFRSGMLKKENDGKRIQLSKVDVSLADLVVERGGTSLCGMNPDPKWLEYRAIVYTDQKKYRLALEDLNTLIDFSPNYPMAYYHRGRANQMVHNYVDAIEDYQRALKYGTRVNSNNNNVNNVNTMTTSKSSRTISHSPSHESSKFRTKKGEKNDSFDLWENVGLGGIGILGGVTLVPLIGSLWGYWMKNPGYVLEEKLCGKIHHNMARCYELLERYNEAIENYEKATTLDTSMGVYHFHMGRCRCCVGDFLQAAKDLTHSVDIDPVNPNVLYYKGISHYNMKEYSKAIDDLKRSLSLLLRGAFVPSCYYHIGLCYSNMRDYQSAIDAFSQAHILSPTYTSALHERAKAYQSIDKHSEAITDFTNFISINPTNSHAYFRRAFSYKALGKYLEAASDLQKAKKIDPDNPYIITNYQLLHNVSYIQICDAGCEPESSDNDISKALNKIIDLE